MMISQKSKQEIWNNGFEAGLLEMEARLKHKEQVDIERKATNLFAETNHVVNPNHVFDLTKAGVYIGMEPITKERAKELKP